MKSFRVEFYADKWVRVVGYVEADSEEEVRQKIEDHDFVIASERPEETEYNLDTLYIEPEE